MSGSTGFYWLPVRALRLPFLSSTQVTGALESKGVFRVIRRERMILWRTAHFLTNCQKVKTFVRSRTYLKDCFWLAGKTIGIVTWQCPYTFTAPWPRAEKPNNDKNQTKVANWSFARYAIDYYFELILAARINYHLTSGFKEQLLWSTGKYALQV